MDNSLPDSPQGIGDLLGLAFRLTRRNLGMIFRFILVPSLFTLAAGVLFQWVFTYGTAAVSESKNLGAALSLAGLFFLAFVIFSLSWWVLGMRLLAVARLLLGFSPSLSEAAKYMSRRKWTLAGLYLLGMGMFSAAAIAIVIACAAGLAIGALLGSASEVLRAIVGITVGLVAVIMFLALASLYMIASNIAFCTLACEERSLPGIIGASLSLTWKYLWRAAAFGILFMVAFSAISYPLSLPVAAVSFVDALHHGLSSTAAGAAYKPPVYLLVLTQAWEAAMGILLRPLMVMSFGLFYYDLRMRNEGLDIRRRLQSLEAR